MKVMNAESNVPQKTVPTEARRSPKLRNARFEDHDQIASLESRFGLPSKPYDEWVHLWKGNPVYRRLKTDWPIGWVLEDDDGKIVGSMGNIPFEYELEGRKLLVASGHNWVADVAYRSASLLLLDNLIRQPCIDLYLNNTVTDQSVSAVTALGCSRIPVGIWDEAAFWITNYSGFLRIIVGIKNPFAGALPGGPWSQLKAMWERFSRPGKHSRSATAFLKGNRLPEASVRESDVEETAYSDSDERFESFWEELKRNSPRVLRAATAIFKVNRWAQASVRESDVEVRACSDFDERFDSFWEELKRNSPRVLLGVRTREVLAWHFKHALLDNRLWIVTAVEGPRLLAYAIFTKKVHPASGLQHVKLADYQSLDGSTSTLGPLLSWALKRCRAEGVHMLEHRGRWLEKGDFIDTAAPFRRKFSSWKYFYHTADPELRDRLREQQAWAPSLFDSDASL